MGLFRAICIDRNMVVLKHAQGFLWRSKRKSSGLSTAWQPEEKVFRAGYPVIQLLRSVPNLEKGLYKYMEEIR